MNLIDLPSLRAAYAAGANPATVIAAVYDRIAAWNDPALFIHLRPRAHAIADAERLAAGPRDLPLFGVPFVIKDNIDLVGCPTTAACPSFAYTPERSATVVERLLAAGAIAIGKTNLDQFATGLVGTRSPHGTPRNPFSSTHVPGGSSAGSAAAVAAGLVTFALGTDTAGSGRVPAAFQNLVGLKPTKGWLSTAGVVPAARTCDCVSIFALSVADAWSIAEVAQAFDPSDPYSRRAEPFPRSGAKRIGFLPESQRIFDHAEDAARYAETIERLHRLGYTCHEVDVTALTAAATLLYGGAFVAERTHAVGEFLATAPPDADPTVLAIVLAGQAPSAVELVADQHRLCGFARAAEALWSEVDLLCLPTTPGIATLDEVAADPIGRNRRLGTYTNWMNLLDCCGLAVPAGFRADGLPVGVTLAAPAWRDHLLAEVGAQLHHDLGGTCGATTVPVPAPSAMNDTRLRLVVVGAHLSGLPLNAQLTALGATLERTTVTAPCYRLYALPGTTPPKPGLVRVANGGGAIACEVWRLEPGAFAQFVAAIPSPLGIGKIRLAEGDEAPGFLCESIAVANAEDITARGGWRAWLAGTG